MDKSGGKIDLSRQKAKTEKRESALHMEGGERTGGVEKRRKTWTVGVAHRCGGGAELDEYACSCCSCCVSSSAGSNPPPPRSRMWLCSWNMLLLRRGSGRGWRIRCAAEPEGMALADNDESRSCGARRRVSDGREVNAAVSVSLRVT